VKANCFRLIFFLVQGMYEVGVFYSVGQKSENIMSKRSVVFAKSEN